MELEDVRFRVSSLSLSLATHTLFHSLKPSALFLPRSSKGEHQRLLRTHENNRLSLSPRALSHSSFNTQMYATSLCSLPSIYAHRLSSLISPSLLCLSKESDFDVHGFVERVARWSATRASASHHGQPEPETDNASWLVEPAEETKGKEEDENDDEEAASAKARKSISAAGGGEADRMLKAFKDTSAELWVLHDQVSACLS